LTRPSWVWDPNPFNPYGGEVARVIGESAGRVVHICRKSVADQHGRVEQWRLIPPAADGKHDLRHVLRYALSLTVFFIAAAIRRPNLVVPWINSRSEAIAVIWLQRLGIRTFVIVHNPTATRDDAPVGSLLHQLREHATHLVVHNAALRANLAANHSVAVAAHPAYFAWAKAMGGKSRPAGRAKSNGPRLLFIGSARADKGFNDLPRLSDEAARRGAVLSISVGRLSPDQQKLLRRCVTAELLTDGTSYVQDDELFRHLMNTDVLIAPYKDVTVSGTVILALTLGVPVVAFNTDGMRGMVDENFLAEPGDFEGLIDVAVQASTHPCDGEIALRLDRQSVRDWRLLLERPPSLRSEVGSEVTNE
jgi:glycosyltransferase involved in cell wall biosynthesis